MQLPVPQASGTEEMLTPVILSLISPPDMATEKWGREKNEKRAVIRCSALQGQVITGQLEN